MATKKNANNNAAAPQSVEPPMPQQQPVQPQPIMPQQPAPVQPMQQQPMAPMQPMQPQPVMQPMQAPAYGQPNYQQPQGSQPQYVVMQQSLKGVGGWLVFFMVLFGLAAAGYIWQFFAAMLNLSIASSIISLIFAPILAGGYIASIVLIAMQKRVAKLVTWITIGVSAVYSLIGSIVALVTVNSIANQLDTYYSSTYASAVTRQSVPLVIAGILVSLLFHALLALYFFMSKRVKETLVN